jgi:hypothetical protein
MLQCSHSPIDPATHDLPHGASMLHCNHNPTKSGTHDLPHSMQACYTNHIPIQSGTHVLIVGTKIDQAMDTRFLARLYFRRSRDQDTAGL